MIEPLEHISLFTGFAGFDLASEKIGWKTIVQVEKDPFCLKLLEYYWPNVKRYYDIKRTNFSIYKGRNTIVTGGFPCQPHSTQGKGKGKEDSRYLWPEMFRAIQEISPRWVVGENVHGIVTRNNGVVFDEVAHDLEAIGYQVQPYVLPACSVNAPHRRYRVFFIAHAEHYGSTRESGGLRKETKEKDKGRTKQVESSGEQISVPNESDNARPEIQKSNTNSYGTRLKGERECSKSATQDERTFDIRDSWDEFPTKSPICRGGNGIPYELESSPILEEYKLGEGLSWSKWKRESIKGYGNAVVPELAYQIFRAIQNYELKY